MDFPRVLPVQTSPAESIGAGWVARRLGILEGGLRAAPLRSLDQRCQAIARPSARRPAKVPLAIGSHPLRKGADEYFA